MPRTLNPKVSAADATQNREEWLTLATEALRPVFKSITGSEVPACRVSVGWPSKGGTSKNKTIGQAWSSKASPDGVGQVFISPIIAEGELALSTLIHELCHIILDCEHGHKAQFGKLATAMGLEGKMTSTNAGAEALVIIRSVIDEVGPFPHAGLTPGETKTKTDGTRMLKVVCPADGYTIRAAKKWLEVGLPSCPCGEVMEPEIKEEAPEDE